jgi:thioredoxin reductase
MAERAVDGVFIAIGHRPAFELTAPWRVEYLTEKQRIKIA